MSRKGECAIADVLKWADIEHLYKVALINKMYNLAKFIIAVSYYGLKAEQALSLKWEDVLSDVFFVRASSGRTITVKNTKTAKNKFMELFGVSKHTNPTDYVILSRYGGKMSIQLINRSLKKLNVYSKLNIKHFSSESFRKTFARHIYDSLPESLKGSGLKTLSLYLGHSSTGTTLNYMGLCGNCKFSFENPLEMFEFIEQRYDETDISKEFIKEYTKPGYVYILKDKTLPKMVKIGKTVSLSTREYTLQAEKPSYEVYKYIKLDCEKASYMLEAKLHKKYREFRVRGEWFELPEKEFNELLSDYSWVDYNKTA